MSKTIANSKSAAALRSDAQMLMLNAALQREEDAASEWRRAVECARRSMDPIPRSVRQSADRAPLDLPSPTYGGR